MTYDNKYTVFTVCNLAYLPKALVLADSMSKFKHGLHIFLIDRKVDVPLHSNNAEITWIEDVTVPNLYELAFKYDITEFSTCLKPLLALYLLGKYNKVVFLDPDTCVYSPIDPVLKDLDFHPIVVTPHYVTPESDSLPDSDVGMMRFGSFNMGFFGVNRSRQGLDFLNWWSDRCLRFCYFETQFGLSTDQKWVSIAPCFFDALHISFNLGYNVAFWNLHERRISKSSDGQYLVNDTSPLIFFHFSSFDEERPELLSKRPFYEKEKRRKDVYELSIDYKKNLDRHKGEASSSKYGFDYMSGGEYISPALRRAYACLLEELPNGHDPFDSNGPVGNLARKNFLFERSSTPYVSNSFGDMSGHKFKFKLIYSCMRLVLFVIGPNRFVNLSRLLVFLSSYRQNRGLWKV